MRRIGLTGVAAVAALGMALAGCTSGGPLATLPAANGASARRRRAAASPSAKPSPAGPVVTITPGNGARGADPSKGITVTAAGGTLKNVSVRTAGDPVTGSVLGRDHASWHSTWALNVSQSYTVTATAAASSGATTTKTAAFRTLTPASTFSTEIFEGYQQSYGVGMPIILYVQRAGHGQGGGRAVDRAAAPPSR